MQFQSRLLICHYSIMLTSKYVSHNKTQVGKKKDLKRAYAPLKKNMKNSL